MASLRIAIETYFGHISELGIFHIVAGTTQNECKNLLKVMVDVLIEASGCIAGLTSMAVHIKMRAVRIWLAGSVKSL